MSQNLLNLLAAVALLVQSVLGPFGPGVALCVSMGLCSGGRAVATGLERQSEKEAPHCCGDCSSERPASSTLCVPSVAVRTPCGDGCGDCLDLELESDTFATSSRGELTDSLASFVDLSRMMSAAGAPEGDTDGVVRGLPPPRNHWSAARAEVGTDLVRCIRLRL